MGLPKKNDPYRKGRAFKKHFLLLTDAFLRAVCIVFIWYQLHYNGVFFPLEDEGLFMFVVVTVAGMIFSIAASLIMATVWKEYKIVVMAVLERDERTFMKYRDERIPIVIHLFLALLSIPLMGTIMFLNFTATWCGALAVFLVAFILALYWVILVDLDNPMKSYWIAERVPEDWKRADVDEYFQLNGKQ